MRTAVGFESEDIQIMCAYVMMYMYTPNVSV